MADKVEAWKSLDGVIYESHDRAFDADVAFCAGKLADTSLGEFSELAYGRGTKEKREAFLYLAAKIMNFPMTARPSRVA